MQNMLSFGKQLFGALFLFGVFAASSANAEGDVILTLADASGEVVAELTGDDLRGMEQVIVSTENEFVDGLVNFEGPLVRDVIALIEDLDSEMLSLTAANDYSVEIPVSDFINYDVIFALSQNGERFSMRDKGPIWVIYPMTDNAELQDRVYNDRLIWQLVRVDAL